MTLRVAELESLFTADIRPFEQAATKVEARQRGLTGSVVDMRVDADTATALRNLDRVDAAAQGIPDGEIRVDADTSAAERKIDNLADDASASFESAGGVGGKAFMGGLVGGLAATPIAGIFTGLAQDAVEGFQSGFQVEVRGDRLAAQVGLDETTAATLGRAAAEAYANNWGESLDANFNTARDAVQSSLLDPAATKRDAQQIISDLAGVSDLIEEETARVARTSAQLIKTGIAADADEAFDIIVKGQQAGLNASEDWLDTLDEYSTKFRDLGLTGPQAIGLLRQAVQAGARDTDTAADALKEFAIRAIDGSDASADGFERLGMNAEEMAAQIAKGGDSAAAGLRVVLNRLREIEDPAERDAIAVELFGTKAEDMGDALYAMDLSNAVDQLGQVEGAAESALATLTDNTQNDIDEALRNIEVAAEGIKGALASAFAPQIEGAANFVTENREAVIQFLLDIANGAIDIGRGFVEGTAAAGEAVGSFIAGPAASLVETLAGIADGMSFAGFGVPGAQEAAGDLRELAENMRGADEAAKAAGDAIRDRLITNGLDVAQDKLNELGEGLLIDARAHDTAYALAKDIDAVGIAADGSQTSLSLLDGELDKASKSGMLVDAQMSGIAQGMLDQATAALEAGDSIDEMNDALEQNYETLVNQLEQMGLTREEAEALAESYGAVPTDIMTSIALDGYTETYEYLSNLQTQIRDLTGDHTIRVATGQGGSGGQVVGNAIGRIIEPMALGGIATAAPIAQVFPPGTLRLIGDRVDVDESYIPHDGSARSMAILLETMRRMGVRAMAAGGVTGTPTIIPQSVTHRTEAPIFIDKFYGSVDDVEQKRRERRFNGLGGDRG